MKLFIFLTLIFSQTAFSSDYQIICRGGKFTSFTYEFPKDHGTFTIEDYNFVFNFSKSKNRAISPYKELPEGSCAWLDRPLNESETPKLVIKNAPFIGRMHIHAATNEILEFIPVLDINSNQYDLYIKTFKLYMKKAGDPDQFLRFRARSMPGEDKRLLITKLGW